MKIIVDTEQEKQEVEALLIEVAERPQLYDSEEKERFVEAEVVVDE